MILLAVMLVIAGFASSQVGNDAKAHDRVGASTVPLSVTGGGSVVDATRSPVTSSALPPMTIALTFDDDPDPTWTPQILSILRKHRVPATFFVVGSVASRHPELLRAMRDSGSEIGLHTFTHPDLVDFSQWQLDRELAQTQMVLAGTAGHPLADGTFDLDQIPLGQALVSAAVVLLLLRLSPTPGWLARTRLVAVLNSRVLTIFLWHTVCIDVSYPVADRLGLSSRLGQLGTAVVLISLAVLLFGWVEDFAARRPLQLFPGSSRARRAAGCSAGRGVPRRRTPSHTPKLTHAW